MPFHTIEIQIFGLFDLLASLSSMKAGIKQMQGIRVLLLDRKSILDLVQYSICRWATTSRSVLLVGKVNVYTESPGQNSLTALSDLTYVILLHKTASITGIARATKCSLLIAAFRSCRGSFYPSQ